MQRILIYRGKTTVYVNASVLLLAAYMLLTGHGELLLPSYVSIILHEGAHAAAACLAGHPPEEVEITPLGAMMRLCTHGVTRAKRLLILLAGPLMTALLCLTSVRCVTAGLLPYHTGRMVFICNCSILMINMLPCPPLDGGGLLALMLSFALPERKIQAVMRFSGRVISCATVLSAFVLAYMGQGMNLSLVLAGCLLIYTAHASTASDALHMLKQCTERKTMLELRGSMRADTLAVLSHIPVVQAVSGLRANRYARFIIIESGTHRVLGEISESLLIAAALGNPAVTCGEVFRKAGNTALQ